MSHGAFDIVQQCCMLQHCICWSNVNVPLRPHLPTKTSYQNLHELFMAFSFGLHDTSTCNRIVTSAACRPTDGRIGNPTRTTCKPDIVVRDYSWTSFLSYFTVTVKYKTGFRGFRVDRKSRVSLPLKWTQGRGVRDIISVYELSFCAENVGLQNFQV